MGRITLNQTGGLVKSDNTFCEYDNEVSEELLLNHIKKITNSLICNDKYVCYLVGMGGVSKKTYLKLKKEKGINVVWFGSILPKYLRFLNIIVASYAGLLKVDDTKKIPNLFSLLTSESMAAVYFFPKEYENEFIKLVERNPLSETVDFGIKKFSNYFFYLVDGDNVESKTGIYEVISYGVDSDYISNVL